MKMNRVLSALQKLRLFGTYWWMGQQVKHVPNDKKSLDHAPEDMCLINSKDKEGYYWICADRYGIRFVAVDTTAGHDFQRGFVFNTEALDRILLWNGKQNTVMFVVATVNDLRVEEG